MQIDPKTEGTNKVPKNATYAAPSKGSKEVLLKTCRVEVTAPDSSVTHARDLLDCAASTSLITERLANKIRLPRQLSDYIYKVNEGVGFNVRTRETVKFKVAGERVGGKPIEVEASVLAKVTNDLPTVPVSPVTRWKHRSDLELADPDYGVPAEVDTFL